MKVYQYDELGKLNQALHGFKKNEIPVVKVKILNIGSKVMYFVLAEPKYKPKKKVEPKKEIKKKKLK